MRLTTDDRVWRFQGRLIELDEVEIPMHPRYVAVGIFLVAAPVFAVLLSPFGWLVTVVGSAMYAGIVAWRIADLVTGEVPVSAWIGVARSEVAARRRWTRDRMDARARRSALALSRGGSR
ncbi:MAG: hypothetical protein ACRCYX_03895 [Dermatophilaceae bacterium]